MATPDYLEQVVVSGRARPRPAGAGTRRTGFFYRPSVSSLFWATADLLTVAMAAIIALYGFLLVALNRSYGLYGSILSRNGLNEQRLTVQAGLTAGLLLCGTLYL